MSRRQKLKAQRQTLFREAQTVLKSPQMRIVGGVYREGEFLELGAVDLSPTCVKEMLERELIARLLMLDAELDIQASEEASAPPHGYIANEQTINKLRPN